MNVLLIDNDISPMLIIATIIAIIWLIYKYRKLLRKNLELSNSIYKLTEENRQLVRANSQLVADNALLEAEHLKFQLQPHTLGNVVSTLNAIAKNLHRGTESLAESLNYILYKGNTHLVSVEDEVGFIRKYIQLNQLLYSDIISVRLDDSQVEMHSKFYKTQCVPHLISAYLVENAYKHGDKTHPEFLKIKVSLIQNTFVLEVSNMVNQRPNQNLNGGLGLKNMEKRLALLLGNKFKIEKQESGSQYQSKLTILLDNEHA